MSARKLRSFVMDEATDRLRAPAERWNHGVEREVDRPTGRENVAKPLTKLRNTGRIGDAEVVAAERFYTAWTFGMEGAREDKGGSTGSSTPDAAMVARMDAAYDYSTATKALPATQIAILRAVVLESRSLTSLAGKSGGRAVGLMADVVAEALFALVEHYHQRDNDGFARPKRIAGGYKGG